MTTDGLIDDASSIPSLIISDLFVQAGEQTVIVGDMFFFETTCCFIGYSECTLMGKIESSGLIGAFLGGALVGGLITGTFAEQNKYRIEASVDDAAYKRLRRYAWKTRERIDNAEFSLEFDNGEIGQLDRGKFGFVVGTAGEQQHAFLRLEPLESRDLDALARWPDLPSIYDRAADPFGFAFLAPSPTEMAKTLLTNNVSQDGMNAVAVNQHYVFSLLALLADDIRSQAPTLLASLSNSQLLTRSLMDASATERGAISKGGGSLLAGAFALFVGLVLATFEVLGGGIKDFATVVMVACLVLGVGLITVGIRSFNRQNALIDDMTRVLNSL